VGGDGDDTILGGNGRDVLRGGPGVDTCRDVARDRFVDCETVIRDE
jgi:RTX calcium-binding nonapeptide repeat (4 copies)